jgi:DNA-binding NarL/FixJ family response regulator
VVRVLLAVAHSNLRAALDECLVHGGELSCGTAATPEELWSRLRHEQWDVLILDLRLPEQTKLQTVRTVHEVYPTLPILVLSLDIVIPPHRWQEAGARGLLSKTKLSTQLIEVVRVISRGGKYFSDEENEGEEKRI